MCCYVFNTYVVVVVVTEFMTVDEIRDANVTCLQFAKKAKEVEVERLAGGCCCFATSSGTL